MRAFQTRLEASDAAAWLECAAAPGEPQPALGMLKPLGCRVLTAPVPQARSPTSVLQPFLSRQHSRTPPHCQDITTVPHQFRSHPARDLLVSLQTRTENVAATVQLCVWMQRGLCAPAVTWDELSAMTLRATAMPDGAHDALAIRLRRQHDALHRHLPLLRSCLRMDGVNAANLLCSLGHISVAGVRAATASEIERLLKRAHDGDAPLVPVSSLLRSCGGGRNGDGALLCVTGMLPAEQARCGLRRGLIELGENNNRGANLIQLLSVDLARVGSPVSNPHNFYWCARARRAHAPPPRLLC